MAGHSKWANIKHRKAKEDAKRGKIFTRLIRELTISARMGGAEAGSNPRLRDAIAKAQAANMSKDTMNRAIVRGAGGEEGSHLEEIVYEGYGSAGVAVLVECMTDNKNRTAAEIRSLFTKGAGSMAGAGSVAWIFEKKGLLVVDASKASEDQLMEIVLSAGAEDLSLQGTKFEIVTGHQEYEAVRKALEQAKIPMESAQQTKIPKNQTAVTAEHARGVINLIDALEDHDDVQHVYFNADIPDEVLNE